MAMRSTKEITIKLLGRQVEWMVKIVAIQMLVSMSDPATPQVLLKLGILFEFKQCLRFHSRGWGLGIAPDHWQPASTDFWIWLQSRRDGMFIETRTHCFIFCFSAARLSCHLFSAATFRSGSPESKP